ncbi:MAG TPA: coenzyme F420-0:L-glutamate ligase [Blastocatellia bacterium]|nr:coenzyme F420-0:L-glutamate ligase [Blastocatellia bacterium]
MNSNSYSDIQLTAVRGIPEVRPGDELAWLIARSLEIQDFKLADGDIVVVAQKIISKAEGRLVNLEAVTPSALALEIASKQNRDPRLVEVILSESANIVRMDAHVLVTETKHGFICANAGVDRSNVAGKDWVALLPIAPDDSALMLKTRLAERLKVDVAVIITDTFGRPWREGLTNVAIGVSGMKPLKDFRGQQDDHGKDLSATVLAVADEVAASTGLLMRKTARIPVVVVRGYYFDHNEGSAKELIRPKERDLFR